MVLYREAKKFALMVHIILSWYDYQFDLSSFSCTQMQIEFCTNCNFKFGYIISGWEFGRSFDAVWILI